MMSMKVTKMQGQNGQQGMWMYQCVHCKKNFPSSQAIAGHTKGHFRDGWVKGTPQRKVFVLFSDYQQQQGSTSDSSIPEKQVFSAATPETDLTDAHQLPKGDVQNARSLAVQPPSPGSSSRQPRIPRHHLRLRDLKILARLRARLTREEQNVILRLLDSAMEQVHSLIIICTCSIFFLPSSLILFSDMSFGSKLGIISIVLFIWDKWYQDFGIKITLI